MLRRIISMIFALCMLFACLPTFAEESVETVSARADSVWDRLAEAERELFAKYRDKKEYVDAVYELYRSQSDVKKLRRESDDRFTFCVGYVKCVYNYELRQKALFTKEGRGEDLTVRKSYGKAHGKDVFLIGPYYGYQDSFTDYYKNLANSLGEQLGGTVTILSGNNATGPAIKAYFASAENNVVTIFDSHGGADNGSSYLCLHTNSGLTSSDYSSQWAVSFSSGYYGVDGRYMTNGMTYELNDNIVWSAICEGMMTDGLCRPFRESGAGVVYGYSQSVSFTRDYEYAGVFWDDMMNNATVAEAIADMKEQYGNYDNYISPYAYPIVVSVQDEYPSNPDSVQTVYSTWTLEKGVDPVSVTSVSLDITDASVLDKGDNTIQLTAAVEPATATNKKVDWTSSDEDVATVSESGLVTAVAQGEAIITVTTRDGGFTATCKITVNKANYYFYEDFEDFDADAWTFADADGDGRNWYLSNSYDDIVYEGAHCITSASYANGTALTPDNWLISPEFTATPDAILLWYDAPQLTSFADENYSVYVLPADYSGLDEGILIYNGVPSGAYKKRSVEIGDFYGQSIRIAFRHHDVTDMYRLNIDLIAVVGTDDAQPVHVTGVSMDKAEAALLEKIESTVQLYATVEPADATNKRVTWSSSDEDILTVDKNGFVRAQKAGEAVVTVTTVDGGFTAECRITVEKPELLLCEDFEDFDEDKWTFVDADGDGYGWYLGDLESSGEDKCYDGTHCIVSASYDQDDGALTPDNWLISSSFNATEDAILFWYDVAQDAGWTDENYSVYVLPADYTDLNEATEVYNGMPGGEYELHKIKLDSYAGQEIRIAFRHYDCTDIFRLNIDLIAVASKDAAVTHTVTFVDGHTEEVISTATVEDGADAEFPEAPEHEGYTFTGWNNDGKNVTEDITITALYEEIPVVTHTVTFVDGFDSTVISTATVEDGADAVLPEAPEHEGYVFIGWDNDGKNITDDITITAQYAYNKHTILFFDGLTNEFISVIVINHGESVTFPEPPEHEGYTFTGWDNDGTNITQDTVITALYTINTYTVTFIDGLTEGVIATATVEHGADATFPEAPEHEGYTFTGWDNDGKNVTEDITITALYEEIHVVTHTVTFIDGLTEEVIATATVEDGEDAVFPEAPEHEGYTFTGWDNDGKNVTEDITITALYEEIPVVTHTVTFIDGLTEEVIATATVEHGADATFPEAPEHEGYELTGWDKDGKNVTEDITITALYEEIHVVTHTVTFIDGLTEEVIATATVEHGADATFPEAPEHEGYEFTGWDKDGKNIKSDTTITAQYKEIENPVTIGDLNGDGKINTADAVIILKIAAGMIAQDENNSLSGDCNHDGKVNTADAVLILKYAAGMITEF